MSDLAAAPAVRTHAVGAALIERSPWQALCHV